MNKRITQHRNFMGLKEFKETFKVGDVIEGYASNKLVRITAIGETRFLYKDADSLYSDYNFLERASTIENIQAMWRKPTIK